MKIGYTLYSMYLIQLTESVFVKYGLYSVFISLTERVWRILRSSFWWVSCSIPHFINETRLGTRFSTFIFRTIISITIRICILKYTVVQCLSLRIMTWTGYYKEFNRNKVFYGKKAQPSVNIWTCHI